MSYYDDYFNSSDEDDMEIESDPEVKQQIMVELGKLMKEDISIKNNKSKDISDKEDYSYDPYNYSFKTVPNLKEVLSKSTNQTDKSCLSEQSNSDKKVIPIHEVHFDENNNMEINQIGDITITSSSEISKDDIKDPFYEAMMEEDNESNGGSNENKEGTDNIQIETSLTTEGITYDELKDLDESHQKSLKLCTTCGKYFEGRMVSYFLEGELTCYHCIFWMNYDISLRENVDAGIVGISIASYILDCSQDHNIETCMRAKSGGCLLCDYLNNVPITGIFDQDKVNKKNTNDGLNLENCDYLDIVIQI